MGQIKWIKLAVDIFDNRKIKQLQALPGGDTCLVIWLKLLVLAGRINDGGRVYITPDMGFTVKALALELGRPKSTVQRTVDFLRSMDMIDMDDRGIITIRNWEKHQSMDAADRARELNRKRNMKYRHKNDVMRDVTVTSRDAPEEEGEEEREEEKEFHSFSHAREGDLRVLEARQAMDGALGGGVVLLSEAQTEDLLARLSMEEFNKYVAIVRDNELSGKHYRKKTHYEAILHMALKDRAIK